MIAIANNKPFVENPVAVNIKFLSVVTNPGNPETIPTKINIEIPFSIPDLVICSPSQISIDVPATKDITTMNPVKNPGLMNMPEELYEK